MSIDLSGQADLKFKPNLFDVHKILDEFIVGEFESRMAVFTNWVLSDRHCMLTGQRSSGKTWITDHVSKLLPDENGAYTIYSGSEKSGWYQAEAMKNHSHIVVLELNKIPKEVIEVLKDWGEGKDSKYKVVVSEGGNRRLQTYKLPCKPFIFCLADEEEMNVGEQLTSRLTVIRTDNSESQNRAVMYEQAKLAMNPKNTKKPPEELLLNMKQHIVTLPPIISTDFKHPASELFVNSIPSFFTDCRRDFPKYLENTNGICRFYWKDRIIVELSKKKKRMFITPGDMYYNHIVYGQILVDSALKCSAIQRSMIDILSSTSSSMGRQEVQLGMRRKGMNISAHMVTRHLNQLADLGYCEKVKVGNSQAVYNQGSMFKEFSFNVDWNKVIDVCKKTMKDIYPKQADEYIKRYCGEEVNVIHPFIGEKIDIRKIEYKEVKKDKGFKEFESKKEVKVDKVKEAIKKEIKEEMKSEQLPDGLINAEEEVIGGLSEEEVI